MGMTKMICTLGKFDIPIIQMQPVFQVNLLDSNIIAFGSAMSGKTTFLKTLLNILHKQYREDQEQIFILDFGSALFSYREMPLVSAYFDNSNEEYVKRVFKIMDGILKDNIQVLNGKNYSESAEEQPIHTTFVIDNLNAFLDEPRYSTYHEKLAKLCRDGLSKGITIVVTASDNKGLNAYMSSFKQKIAFELPQDEYAEIFNNKVGAIGNYPGHGFANVTVRIPDVPGSFRYNLPYEFQCSAPYITQNNMGGSDGSNTEEMFKSKLQTKFEFKDGRFHRRVKKYRTFPKELTRKSYADLLENGRNDGLESQKIISVGLDYVDFNPVTVDLMKSHVIGIYGKKEFGKTNLLRLLLNKAADCYDNLRIVLVDDGRKQLSSEILGLSVKKTNVVSFSDFSEVELQQRDGSTKKVKRSPLQQFFVYLNENYINWDKKALATSYGISSEGPTRNLELIPNCSDLPQPMTVFVLQSKMFFLKSRENAYFFGTILPQLIADAEEKRIAVIFSDIQKFSETDQYQYLNNVLSTVFLLDNIAEFASERGQRTVFGSMDSKALKEDYARCELGDGYFYDVEADNLKKMKFLIEDKA